MFRPVRDSWYISGWDVRQYTYCPMIPWLKANYSIEEPPTYSMELGSSIEKEHKESVAKKLKLPKPWRFNIVIQDVKEGLVGIIDILAGKGPYIVVEVKAFKRNNYEHYITQLLLYTYIVNKVLGPVRNAYLVLGNKVIKYEITDETIKRVRKLIAKVRAIKTSTTPPLVRRSSKCNSCWYRRYCRYLDINE
ncbi:MAG: CRISPR-associated protein Cas4 [Desulfurococcales archaeon ex4484_42]|nr:MAG: CRISPR-associated protein Cas4 [Desulfurococcales archaeon ex4484_42]